MSSFKSEKDAGFDMDKYTGERVRVKFQGGRECEGVLKGFDKLDNLVLRIALSTFVTLMIATQ